jgi:hypothetical protein
MIYLLMNDTNKSELIQTEYPLRVVSTHSEWARIAEIKDQVEFLLSTQNRHSEEASIAESKVYDEGLLSIESGPSHFCSIRSP